MRQSLLNKIEAHDRSIRELLNQQKFSIDYFQREYRWEERHVVQLIDDLTGAFLKSYQVGQERKEVANFQSYYLGPVVFSLDDKGYKSIVDGQQRITTLTLLLIFLNHAQKDLDSKVSISDLIFSEKYGAKAFNMIVEERHECLSALFETGVYEPKKDDDETVINLTERYKDIHNYFPEEIDKAALPYFIDWLIENVILVEIMAYSDENAYLIFETMNDRGLNLTPTEMLKGYVLSKITDRKKRGEINEIWKHQIQKLHEYDDKGDLSFFPAWFRAKYAQTIRIGRVGAENQDFENISPAFHRWFRDNHFSLFSLKSAEDFYKFFKEEFPFFVGVYLKIWDASMNFRKELECVYYMAGWGIAESLREPLLLASVKIDDKPKDINKKLNFVARYIEIFTIRRSINYKNFGQSAIKYTMFSLIRVIRDTDPETLGKALVLAIEDISEKWDGLDYFILHGMNRRFIKHFLARVSSYVDRLAGKDIPYMHYQEPEGKPYEIEHIWADKFEEHRDEFDQESDFKEWRNSIGALALLQRGTNQSLSSASYERKLEHYIKENTYVQTLHSLFYERNPNFLKSPLVKELPFKPHNSFKKADILQRKELLKSLCEQIWSVNYFLS